MADNPEKLTRFSISETPGGYLFDVEGDGGGNLIVQATADQVDALLDALDDLLAADEATADEVQHKDG